MKRILLIALGLLGVVGSAFGQLFDTSPVTFTVSAYYKIDITANPGGALITDGGFALDSYSSTTNGSMTMWSNTTWSLTGSGATDVSAQATGPAYNAVGATDTWSMALTSILLGPNAATGPAGVTDAFGATLTRVPLPDAAGRDWVGSTFAGFTNTFTVTIG